MKDTYKTISSPVLGVLYKEKGSKFIGYAYPVENEQEIEDAIVEVKKIHHKARHFCFAWQLEKDYSLFRVNDDGEPNNSAGMPIYGQLQSYHLTNCFVVIVRYFGGTKLGVGGLINAYKTTAQLTLNQAKIKLYTINEYFYIKCNYDLMNVVMRYVEEEKLSIVHQDLALDCNFTIGVRRKRFEQVIAKFQQVYGLKVSHPTLPKDG